jgi:predicted N-acetyltransferase YhbS
MSADAETCDWEIRRERTEDGFRIEALTEAGFGPGRYAKSAYRLREGVRAVADLSFVAVENSALRGSVRFWPIKVGGDDVLLLGPLAVDSAQRGRGIGREIGI